MRESGADRDIDVVDLRSRAVPAADVGGGGLGAFLLAVVGLTVASSVAWLAIELTLAFSAASLPVEGFSFSAGGPDGAPGGWRLSGVDEVATRLRPRDLVVEVDGVPALRVLRSDSLKRDLDRRLGAGEAIDLTILREPSFSKRSFYSWSFLIAGGSGGGPYVRGATLDPARAGLGVEEALRSFDAADPALCGAATPPCPADAPWLGLLRPELGLAGAARALEAWDPSLRSLPAGTELRLGVRGDEVARPLVAVTPPDGRTVQLDGTGGSWVVIPAGTSVQPLSLVRRPWRKTLVGLAAALLVTLIAVVGLLALRARAAPEAARHFATAAAILSLAGPLGLMVAFERWHRPLSRHLDFGDQTLAYPVDGDWRYASVFLPRHLVILVAVCAAVLLLAWLGLRLLHTFPSPEPELERRYRVPWRWVGVSALLAVGMGGLVAADSGPTGLAVWGPLLSAIVAVAFSVLVAAGMLVQIARLSVARLGRTRAGEDARRARLALAGLALGAILLVLVMVVPTGYVESLPWTVALNDAIRAAKDIMLPLAVAIPFLAFFVAITRSGLWDVDLVIERATLVSVLTGLFLVAWLVLEASVESLLDERLGGVPVVGGMAPALLAAGVVAVSRRSVAATLARRRRAAGASFGTAIRAVAESLAAEPRADRLPARLVAGIDRLAGPSWCAVLLGPRDGGPWRAWRRGAAGPASVAGAAVLERLAAEEHVVALLDSGPVLATRIGAEGRVDGALLLAERQDAPFYGPPERELVSLMLAGLAPRLTAGRDPGVPTAS